MIKMIFISESRVPWGSCAATVAWASFQSSLPGYPCFLWCVAGMKTAKKV